MSENKNIKSLGRRQALGSLGLMGAGAVLASCSPAIAAKPDKTNLDSAILNFALNLEYLEAAFYLAAVGRLSELQAIGGGASIVLPAGITGNTSIAFTDAKVAGYAQEIAQDELNHVKFLRTVLGSKAVDRPTIDVGPAFAAAANAAAKLAGLPTPLSPDFNPYLNDLFFLHGAFIFEDVGVTAYKGAARLIYDDSANGVLEQAAGILAVEAYHAGEVRTSLYAQKDVKTPYGVTVETLIQAISNLRAAAGGGKDEGITKNGMANIIPADQNSVAYSRTPRQVANIVLLDTTGTATKGGFFPDGLKDDGNLATLLKL